MMVSSGLHGTLSQNLVLSVFKKYTLLTELGPTTRDPCSTLFLADAVPGGRCGSLGPVQLFSGCERCDQVHVPLLLLRRLIAILLEAGPGAL
jgi:hypothetical protein